MLTLRSASDVIHWRDGKLSLFVPSVRLAHCVPSLPVLHPVLTEEYLSGVTACLRSRQCTPLVRGFISADGLIRNARVVEREGGRGLQINKVHQGTTERTVTLGTELEKHHDSIHDRHVRTFKPPLALSGRNKTTIIDRGGSMDPALTMDGASTATEVQYVPEITMAGSET